MKTISCTEEKTEDTGGHGAGGRAPTVAFRGPAVNAERGRVFHIGFAWGAVDGQL
jgi:hypothetical protein